MPNGVIFGDRADVKWSFWLIVLREEALHL